MRKDNKKQHYKRQSTKMLKIFENAVIFILSRSDEEIRQLEPVDVAGAVACTLADLSREFKTRLKTDIPGYIKREIIHRCLFILEKDKKITIKELAIRFGFHHSESLEAAFKDYFQIEPVRYREIRKKKKNKPNSFSSFNRVVL